MGSQGALMNETNEGKDGNDGSREAGDSGNASSRDLEEDRGGTFGVEQGGRRVEDGEIGGELSKES